MVCQKCGKDKVVSEFYYNKTTKRFFVECKECNRARNRKWCEEHRKQRLEHKRHYAKKHSVECTAKVKRWAQEHPEARKRISATWRWKIRLEIIKEYGGKCSCCGETIPEFLTIDHIDGKGAEHRRQMGKGKTFAGAAFYLFLREQGYPKDNYQLLCMNCNFAKGHFRVCPHQIVRGGE